MKVVVTGGAGFIGSNLLEKLLQKKKYKIVVLDNLSTGHKENLREFREKIKFVKCDLSINGAWQKEFKNAKIVFHLAGLADVVPSIEIPEKYYKANVTASLLVMETAKKYNVSKVIYTASSSCYGIPENFPTNEDTKISPKYPYALTKYLGERIVLHWGKIYGINTISLRLFNVYGPKSRTSGTYGAVFGVFLAQKLANKPLTVVGNGKQKRDFTYVSDVVDCLIIASNSNIKNNYFNVGSGNTYSINKLVKLLKGKKTYIPKRPGEPDCTWADISKIYKYLNWKPKISLEEGVNNLLKQINYWQKAPLWTKSKIKTATKTWFKYL